MTNIEALNNLIRLEDTNQISDGYHTFGELYEHRIELYIALCRVMQKYSDVENEIFLVWKSTRHSDGSAIDGWFVLGLFRKAGEQITYHLPMSKWDDCVFAETLVVAPEFDGHSPSDALERIKKIKNTKK